MRASGQKFVGCAERQGATGRGGRRNRRAFPARGGEHFATRATATRSPSAPAPVRPPCERLDQRLEIEHLFDVGKQDELDPPILLPIGVGVVAGDGVGVAVTRRV